jgi:hypothetical protein
VQLVIFLHTFTASCICPKIDVMERVCKKLEFGGDLNRPCRVFVASVTKQRMLKAIFFTVELDADLRMCDKSTTHLFSLLGSHT